MDNLISVIMNNFAVFKPLLVVVLVCISILIAIYIFRKLYSKNRNVLTKLGVVIIMGLVILTIVSFAVNLMQNDTNFVWYLLLGASFFAAVLVILDCTSRLEKEHIKVSKVSIKWRALFVIAWFIQLIACIATLIVFVFSSA